MSISSFFSLIKEYFLNKRTEKLLTRYENALFSSAATYTYRKVSYPQIFSFTESETTKPELALLLFCTADCYATRALLDAQAYCKQNVQIIVLTDNETYPVIPKKLLKKIASHYGNSIYITHNACGIKHALLAACHEITADTVFLVAGPCGYPKTLLYDMQDLPLRDYAICAETKTLREACAKDMGFSALSGTFVQKDAFRKSLQIMPESPRFWVSSYLLPRGAIYTYEKKLVQHYANRKYFLELFGYLARQVMTEETEREKILERLLSAFHDIETQRDLSKLHHFVIAATFAYLWYRYEFTDETLKERISNEFDFGNLLEEKRIWSLATIFMPKLATHCPTRFDALVIENYGMEDIARSSFYAKLCANYYVKYLQKRTNFTYYHFNNLCIRLYAELSKIVISSGSLNRNMVSDRTKLFTLWHGLGLLKETVVKPKKFRVGTIICSSKACEDYYERHFHADSALGLGSIQTDPLHDTQYVASCRKKVRQKYQLNPDTRLVFFAPTFRLTPTHTYDFMMDIDAIGERLAANNIFLIAKRHYIFDHVLAQTGRDTSGLRSSKNGAFVVERELTFTELVCACDVFMTDYSSGIFYAAVLKKPLVLYAPDITAYESGENGFIIDYPKDIPAVAVTEPNGYLLIKALLNPSDPNSLEYHTFRTLHVGNCDGQANERVYAMISQALDQDLPHA